MIFISVCPTIETGSCYCSSIWPGTPSSASQVLGGLSLISPCPGMSGTRRTQLTKCFREGEMGLLNKSTRRQGCRPKAHPRSPQVERTASQGGYPLTSLAHCATHVHVRGNTDSTKHDRHHLGKKHCYSQQTFLSY